jgi:hypothetical protein
MKKVNSWNTNQKGHYKSVGQNNKETYKIKLIIHLKNQLSLLIDKKKKKKNLYH